MAQTSQGKVSEPSEIGDCGIEKENSNMAEDWLYRQFKEADYLGWLGLGPILGVRYFAKIDEKYVILVSKYLSGGVKFQLVDSLAVTQRETRSASMFYFVYAFLSMYLIDPFSWVDFWDTINVSISFFEAAVELFIYHMLFFIVSITISWLFDRPRIDLILEGGTKVGTYTSFGQLLTLRFVKNLSRHRGQRPSESANASSPYYVFQARSFQRFR